MDSRVREARALREKLKRNDSTLTHLVIQDRLEDVTEWARALEGNTVVQKVVIAGGCVSDTAEAILCNFLEALGGLKVVETVEIAIARINVRKRFLGRFVAKLIRSTQTLRTLFVWPFLFLSDPVDDTLALADAIRGHRSLSEIVFLNLLLPTSAISLDPLIRSFSTVPNLRLLGLAVSFKTQEEVQIVGDMDALKEVLLCNKLESLALRNMGLTDEHCTTIVETLYQRRRITKLKALDLRYNKNSCYEGMGEILKMLEHNYVLEVLETDPVQFLEGHSRRVHRTPVASVRGKIQREQLDFWLRLNRAGRHTLLGDPDATRADCLNALSKASEDLDAIYFLLRSRPSLCKD